MVITLGLGLHLSAHTMLTRGKASTVTVGLLYRHVVRPHLLNGDLSEVGLYHLSETEAGVQHEKKSVD